MRPNLRWSHIAGVRRVELTNSPNMPGTTGDPDWQSSHRVIERLTEQVLAQVHPDVVHVHELSGHCLSILERIQARGIPSVVSFHNYWPICPQLNLVDASGAACEDYGDGEKCTRCHWLPPVGDRFWVEQARSVLIDTPMFGLGRGLRRFTRQLGQRDGVGPPQPPGWGVPRHTAVAFAQRRHTAIRLLNQANVIHAMSSRSAAVLISYGVLPDRIQVMPISLFNLDHIRPSAVRGTTYPVVFGYRGTLSYVKGVHVLIEAFAQLDQARGRLMIYGSGEPEYETQLRRLASSLNVSFEGEYSAKELAEINKQTDVGVIPSICEETFCLVGIEFLQSGVPVIASRMGGMLDYMEDRGNGLLVNPRDVSALRDAMALCIESPALLTQMRSRIRQNHPSMDQVSDSFLRLYADILKGV
jgi:glycosyltransferase involved in cell wall biosynthesis